MLLQRLLALLTGVIVAVCLGLGLMLMATGPAKKATDVASTPAEESAVVEAPAAPELSQSSPSERPARRAKIDALIAAAPEYARFFDRLHEAFPEDYDAALESFAAGPPSGRRDESADLFLSQAVRLLRQSRGILAAKAEPGPLGKVFDMQLDVLRAISAQNKRLCAAFLYGGVDQDFQRFASGRRALVADMAIAGLDAIVSGQSKKIDRGAPTEADFSILENALTARGLGKVEIDALLDGKMPDPPLDDARMCAAGQTYLEALRALPEAVRLRIYSLAVELMARS